MSYIEVKKTKNAEYVSFVKKFSFMGQNFRIKEHIGKNISTVNIKEYLLVDIIYLIRHNIYFYYFHIIQTGLCNHSILP